MQSINHALIAIGSNLGDRGAYIQGAIDLIQRFCGTVTGRATIYRSLPVGNASKEFLNTAITIETVLGCQQLLSHLLNIEQELGRVREVHWGDRTIDLDIILYGDSTGQLVIDTPGLRVPHPMALLRDFVLIPAAEIAPDWQHPLTGLNLESERNQRCPGITLERYHQPQESLANHLGC